MRKKIKLFLIPALISALLYTTVEASVESVKIGTVNLKTIADKSKFGKHEREIFEAMQKQMESILKEKEKKLTDLATKLQDEDYLDSISAEAERELKKEFRTLSQEFAQIQNQCYQTVEKANLAIMQKLADIITKSSDPVAKEKKLDLVLNESMSYFAASFLDITDPIIMQMDELWEKELKDNKQNNDMSKAENEPSKTPPNQNRATPQPKKNNATN